MVSFHGPHISILAGESKVLNDSIKPWLSVIASIQHTLKAMTKRRISSYKNGWDLNPGPLDLIPTVLSLGHPSLIN